MALARQVEVRSLQPMQSGTVEFYTPQTSHETMLVQLPSGTIDELFVHRFQTDQLLVVKGGCVLVILKNRQYEYIPLHEAQPTVVTIPPGVPHGAINLSQQACVVVNAVLRHGPAHAKDYQPLKRPFPYDLSLAQAVA
ncbi:MAG: dTDP-4-dehydrorhamnose 3,5-epimerase [Leptolyngbyaceae cyanobacterium bins.349]|nr:dTDP-4-dehydrorhamnose 3,5-epimerase [Leptolyngbyaceae cyanobacterium bins.349]